MLVLFAPYLKPVAQVLAYDSHDWVLEDPCSSHLQRAPVACGKVWRAWQPSPVSCLQYLQFNLHVNSSLEAIAQVILAKVKVRLDILYM